MVMTNPLSEDTRRVLQEKADALRLKLQFNLQTSDAGLMGRYTHLAGDSLAWIQAELDEAFTLGLRAGEAQGWQPIETAPKDGTPIRLKWQGTTVTAIGRWTTPERAMDEWRDIQGNDILTMPTHWMPLPNPPAIRASAAAGETP